MKCLLWKCWILTVALALVLVLGAFAEGSMSLPLAAALCLAGYRILRAAWAAEQRAERQAREASAETPGASSDAATPYRDVFLTPEEPLPEDLHPTEGEEQESVENNSQKIPKSHKKL